MVKDMTKAIKVIDEQQMAINQCDNALNTIYNTFDNKTQEEKESALNEYIKLLNSRITLTSPLDHVKLYLLDIVRGLDRFNLSWRDRRMHKQRIKWMKERIETAVCFDEEAVENNVDNKVVNQVPEVKETMETKEPEKKKFWQKNDKK
jgi:rubrerythrin